MCLIAVKGSGVDLPNEKNLLHAEKRNSDGIGVMYWKPNTNDVIIKKDFKDAEELIKWSSDNIKKEDILVIHFRLATHGLKDIGNRHPFPITKNKELLRKAEVVCQIAVAHNGVISNYGHHNKFSDTQKFVLDILADDSVKNNIDSPAVQKLINSFIDGDKLAILRNDGVCYRFGQWEEENGIYYSNNGYKQYEWTYGRGFGGGISNWRDDNFGNYPLLNSSVSKKVEDEAWYAECDGCKEKKLVRYVEVGDNAFILCKSCRKKARKGKLEVVEETIISICCDSCGEYIEEKDLILTPENWRVCEKCYNDMVKSGDY